MYAVKNSDIICKIQRIIPWKIDDLNELLKQKYIITILVSVIIIVFTNSMFIINL